GAEQVPGADLDLAAAGRVRHLRPVVRWPCGQYYLIVQEAKVRRLPAGQVPDVRVLACPQVDGVLDVGLVHRHVRRVPARLAAPGQIDQHLSARVEVLEAIE